VRRPVPSPCGSTLDPMVPLLKYSVMRLALFVAVLGILAVLGAGPLLAVIGAALVSMLLSYVLLRGTRDELATTIADRVQRRTEDRVAGVVDEDTAIEDAAADAHAAREAAALETATRETATRETVARETATRDATDRDAKDRAGADAEQARSDG
jgi:Protein of unknown function (DUF4229)